MRGFTDSRQPCYLHVSQTFATAVGAPGPFEIDGSAAERESDGLLVTVAGTRYLVPMQHVVMVSQRQDSINVPDPVTSSPGQDNRPPAPRLGGK